MSLEKAAACVRRHKSFLIVSHTNPEGDSLGSQLAFVALLRKLGKAALIVNEDRVPQEYNFLPDKEEITRYKRSLKPGQGPDCFVVLDCADLKRCGQARKLIRPGAVVLNIDHHISNKGFGNVNWVDHRASSCSEMVYRLYKKFKAPVAKDAALELYAGIMSDTGSFRYSNTTALSHRIAAELLKSGIDVPAVFRAVYGNIPFEDMKLLGSVLPRIKLEEGGRVAWFQVTRGILRKKSASFDLAEHILSFARSVKGVEVCVLFKENLSRKNEVRVNFRSQGAVDVNKIAAHFAGGGHKTAAGCTIRGNPAGARRQVLAYIRESLSA
jgi:phosphoesterase RecJ-like protein